MTKYAKYSEEWLLRGLFYSAIYPNSFDVKEIQLSRWGFDVKEIQLSRWGDVYESRIKFKKFYSKTLKKQIYWEFKSGLLHDDFTAALNRLKEIQKIKIKKLKKVKDLLDVFGEYKSIKNDIKQIIQIAEELIEKELSKEIHKI